MKHMWKKNQIIITALAALVAVAGYLNYSGTKLGENALPASTTETEATKTLRLDTYEGNEPAIALYTKLGYRDVGITLFHFQNAIWENLRCFEKAL